jgi:hypothetical protein
MMRTLAVIIVACFFILVSCSGPASDKGALSGNSAQGENQAAVQQAAQKQPGATQSAPTAKSTEKDCSTYEQGSTNAGTCYSMLAEETGNYQLCEQIEGNDAIRSGCFNGVAAKLQDESVCDQMTLPESEDYQQQIEIGVCKEFVKSQSGIVNAPAAKTTAQKPAKSGVTLEQCKAMTDQEQGTTGQCYFMVAVAESDYTICNNIQGDFNVQTRIQCYNNVAAKLKDESVCDSMNVPGYAYLDMAKQQCRRYVAEI